MKHVRRLDVEQLEDRCVPATWGNPWPDAQHLTLSFAPDGTQVGDRVSGLFSTLDAQAPTAAWQRELLRAFQTWAVYGNINVSVQADGGQAFGTKGVIQGDQRFGDVRLAAYAMSPEVLAIASPFEATSGTWAGDVKLNSLYEFSTNGSTAHDLYSVMLHEAGHVYGLDHSADPNSPLYESYRGRRTGLIAEDIARIQSLYGVRGKDAYDAKADNGQFTSATALILPSLASGVALEANADITTVQDKDMYSFKTVLHPTGIQVQLKTSGISLLTARVTVYDAAQKVIASKVSTDPQNGDLVIQLSSVKALSTYYVKVEGASGDVFGMGSYQLSINYLPGVGLPVGTLLGVVNNTANTLLNVDLHTNDSFLTALNLGQLIQKTDSRFDYVFKGSIHDSRDVDFYRIKAPTASAGTSNVLTAMIWGLEANGLAPRVQVYNQNQQLVDAQVLVNDGGTYTIQIANAVSGATYYVKVNAAQPEGTHNIGNYFLGVDFSSKAVQLQQYASGALDASDTQDAYQLNIQQSQLHHFVLSAKSQSGSGEVWMTIHDRAGNLLLQLVAPAGETVSGDVFLRRGTYIVRFMAMSSLGAPLSLISYDLRGIVLSDPVGPQPEDPTGDPAGNPPTNSDPSTDPSWEAGPENPDASDDFYWDDPSYSDNYASSPQDPYQDPWWYY